MDLSFLQPVYGHRGPYVSVYINVSRDAEDADKAIAVRWRNAREELADQDVDESTLQALDGVVGRDDEQGGPRGQVAFAAAGSVVFDVLVTEPPQNYAVRVAPLPDPMPYLSRRGMHVPYVLAVCDSIGADVTCVDIAGRLHRSQVEGEDHPVHKPREGGEHHKQMQRAVDEQVKGNAAKVARQVREFAATGAAELIIVAGEVSVRQPVLAELEGGTAIVVEARSGSRAAGSAGSPLDTEVAGLLREHADRQRQAVIDEYEQERGTENRAVEGLAPTAEALRRGEVETLLWSWGTGGPGDEVSVGPDPEQFGFTEQEVRDLGVDAPERDSVEPALVRAAAGTGAGLVLVDDESVTLHQGIGAVLRTSDPTLPA